MYLQNVYSPTHVNEQGVSLALATCERLLAPVGGAWRVHAAALPERCRALSRWTTRTPLRRRWTRCSGRKLPPSRHPSRRRRKVILSRLSLHAMARAAAVWTLFCPVARDGLDTLPVDCHSAQPHKVFAGLFQKAAGDGAEPHKLLRSHRKARKNSEAAFSELLSPGSNNTCFVEKGFLIITEIDIRIGNYHG